MSEITTSTLKTEWRSVGKSIVLNLNRPKALNSLDNEMCDDISNKILSWHENELPNVFIVKGNGGKSFCAGGDVKSIANKLEQPNKNAENFFRSEYKMNYLLGTSKVPQVSLWDGIVMGGGVGLSVYGKFRIATEKSLFAMPECAIGIFPDVGASWFLPRLPGK